MSKLKTPQDKKRHSLARDTRNAYGENAKSSRKNISRSKQLSHQAVRKAANQAANEILKTGDLEGASSAEVDVRSIQLSKERNSFEKWPDATLGATLIKKRTGAWPTGFRSF